jgi:general stress protein 26
LSFAHLAVAITEALVAADTQQHLYDLVKHYDTALVITYRPDGKAHARPMAVAQLQADLDAYFATSITSPKVAEIEANPRIVVAFQSKSEDAVIYGKATIVRDRGLIHKLWSESWRLWFPGGKDDPSICLVRVDAEEGEYWDRSGVEGLKFIFEAGKAIMQGRQPHVDDDPQQHARVPLAGSK